MRVVVFFLAMAVAAGVVPAAQCVVRCAEPPSKSSCHHAPSKQSPARQQACDALMSAAEAPVLRVMAHGADFSLATALAETAAPVDLNAGTSQLPRFHAPPPRSAWAANHPVLRI